MRRVALKGLWLRRGPRHADRARGRPRRRDGLRHLRPHGHDLEGVRRHLHGRRTPRPAPSSPARRSSGSPPSGARDRCRRRCSRKVRRARRRTPPAADRARAPADQVRADRTPRARRSATRTRRSSASASTAGARFNPLKLVDGRWARRRAARSSSTRAPPTRQDLEVGDTVGVAAHGAAAAVQDRRRRQVRQRQLARRRDDRRLRPPDRPARCSARRASSTRSTSPPARRRRPSSSSRGLKPIVPPDAQVRTRRAAGRRRLQGHQGGDELHPVLPARVRRSSRSASARS